MNQHQTAIPLDDPHRHLHQHVAVEHVAIEPTAAMPAHVLASLGTGGGIGAEHEDPAKDRQDQDLLEGWTLSLPRGRWVRFRPIDDLPNGVRKALRRRLVQMEDDQLGRNLEINDECGLLLLAALIDSWSLPFPLPLTEDTWDQVPGVVAAELELAAGRFLKAVFPNFSAGGGPDTPTPPSGD